MIFYVFLMLFNLYLLLLNLFILFVICISGYFFSIVIFKNFKFCRFLVSFNSLFLKLLYLILCHAITFSVLFNRCTVRELFILLWYSNYFFLRWRWLQMLAEETSLLILKHQEWLMFEVLYIEMIHHSYL